MRSPYSDLIQYIKHPESMGAESIANLDEWIKEFPYAPFLRCLLVRALANTHSTRISQEVKKTAIHLPEREVLFFCLNHGKESEHAWVELSKQIESARENNKQTQSSAADDFFLIEQFLDRQYLHAPSQDDSSASESIIESYTPTYDPEKALGQYEMDINAAEYSLEDLLGYDDAETDFSTDTEQDRLIDDFIAAEKEGKLFVPTALSPHDRDHDITEDIDVRKIKERAFLTESLAKVYIRQHKYEQALVILRELNLRYPKKISYFADQIRFLEKIIAYQTPETPRK